MTKTWQWIIKDVAKAVVAIMTSLILLGVGYLINDVRKLRDDMADVKMDVTAVKTKLSMHLNETTFNVDWTNPLLTASVVVPEKKGLP